jgi:hypothetical protein
MNSPMVAQFVCNIALRKELKENDAGEKNQRFGARVAHRIRMTKKINREAKEPRKHMPPKWPLMRHGLTLPP